MADPIMYQAVQKIATGRIEKDRDLFIRNMAQRKGKTPSEIGIQLQVFDEVLLLTEAIFRDLRQFKKTENVPTKNPGR